MTGGVFFTDPITIGFWRWPLLHVVSRFVSVCINDVWFLLPHFCFGSRPFSCLVPNSFSLYFYYFEYCLFISASFTQLHSSRISLSLPPSLFQLCFLSAFAVFQSLHFRFFSSSLLLPWAYFLGLYFILTLSSQTFISVPSMPTDRTLLFNNTCSYCQTCDPDSAFFVPRHIFHSPHIAKEWLINVTDWLNDWLHFWT